MYNTNYDVCETTCIIERDCQEYTRFVLNNIYNEMTNLHLKSKISLNSQLNSKNYFSDNLLALALV